MLSSWPWQDKTVCCWVLVKRYGGQKHTLALGIFKWCMKLWSKWGDRCVSLMSAFPWSIRIFCYLCPLGSCISLREGTGCSPGEEKGIKGQALAWWISANSVDSQCSRQHLLREVLQKKQWLMFMNVKTIICHTAANLARFLRQLWSCIWSVYLSKWATVCYTLLLVVSYSMLCLNEFWGVIMGRKSDCNC